MILLRLRIAGKDEEAPIGGRQANVDHLDGRHFLDHRATGQPWRQNPQPLLQGDIQTIGQKRYKDVSLDARVLLVIDGADGQITFEIAEDGFDFRQLNVALPQDRRVFIREVRPQQIVPFVADSRSQLFLA